MNKNLIWIVDDDIIYQTIIKKLIQKSCVFCGNSSFINGKEAIISLSKIIEENNKLPDIILLDINMPVMDGWEFMEEIKNLESKINQKIKIYIVSSSIAIEDKNKAKNYENIIDYITKPISIDDLVALVT